MKESDECNDPVDELISRLKNVRLEDNRKEEEHDNGNGDPKQKYGKTEEKGGIKDTLGKYR